MSKLSCIAAACALLLAAAVHGQAPNAGPRSLCANRQVGRFVRDVRNCRDYFTCNERREAVPGSCPAPYLFDEANQKCNFASLVTCFACDRNLVFSMVPVAGTCNEYIRCAHDVPEHRVCPSDLHFDRRLGQCNVPAAARCIEEVAEVPVCPANADRPHWFRDPEDCTRYTICLHGRPEERQCPEGLHFNLRINQCDRPAAAGCLPEGDSSFDCSAQTPLVPPLYANPDDCRSGFACSQGIANKITCGADTVWNQEVQGCVVGECDNGAAAPASGAKRPVKGGRPVRPNRW